MIVENQVEWRVSEEDAGERLDKWLIRKFLGMYTDSEVLVSRSQAQKWIEEGLIRVTGDPAFNGNSAKEVSWFIPEKNYKLHAQELVCKIEKIRTPKKIISTLNSGGISKTIDTVYYNFEEGEILPQNIPLEILYEDEFLLVVNKPKGMVVHPAPGNQDNTLVNALVFHCGDKLAKCNGEHRQGIVHRIDKDTSGLLVVAKEDTAYEALAAQAKAHTMERFYEAVVYGRLKQENGTIDLPIGRSTKDRKKMAVVYNQQSRDAITHFEVLKMCEKFTHVRCKLETGRTHQIRVHMAYIGHPIAGDSIYGPKKVIKSLQGQCLHARALGFIHPATGEKLYFESPLPEYFQKFLRTV